MLSHHILGDPNALVLDIRTRDEFCRGHLSGAILVETLPPPHTMDQTRALWHRLWAIMQHVDSRTPVYVYCRLGKRAAIARDMISQYMGHRNVWSLGGVEEGQLKSWIESGQVQLQRC